MAEERMVAALDIGTTKIVALVGEMDEQGGIYVIGHGQAPAEGLRRGIVVDMDKTVKSIRKAVEDAQMVSGTEIDRVTVGIAGEHIRSINSHGVIAVGRSDNEITAADVNRAIEAARTVAIPVDREIIHVIPQSFSVDDQTGIKDPVGMSGVRLEVEAHIVTASVTSAKNIYRALERCNLIVDHMVLESLATSHVLLSENEMEIGAVVVDIGGDITNLSVFYDGAIRHTAVVTLGSKNVTNDIAIGLRVSVDQADELKLSYGSALASIVDPEEMLPVQGVAGREARDISCNVLASIIEPRMEEVFSLVEREMKRVHHGEVLTAGMVLTGGGAMLPGTVELAEQMFDLPVRKGMLRGIDHTPEELNNIRFATAHGLLLYGFTHEPPEGKKTGSVRSIFKRIENWISRQL
ncbi:MAG: cell division protein FtsA [Anaerolineales bacterium]|jgi:cell division protein FtsA